MPLRVGAHLSIAGGLDRAVECAAACGRGESCWFRFDAFRRAGVADPLPYER